LIVGRIWSSVLSVHAWIAVMASMSCKRLKHIHLQCSLTNAVIAAPSRLIIDTNKRALLEARMSGVNLSDLDVQVRHNSHTDLRGCDLQTFTLCIRIDVRVTMSQLLSLAC
jgi:hypothetical protein